MNKNKIILLTDSLGGGGAQRQLVGLAKMLHFDNKHVEVCTYFNNNFFKKDLDALGIINTVIPRSESKLTRIFAILKYIKKQKPRCVIAYQETPSLIAALCRCLGCRYKLLVSERNTTQRIGWNEMIRFFLYRWADAIVPNSYTQEKFLLEHYPYLKNKVSTVTNFVDLNKFKPSNHSLRIVPKILVVASIWPPKNTKGFIEACKILNKRGVKYQVDWYGKYETSSTYCTECENLLKEHSIANVHLLPKTYQIVEKYKDADFFCLPSFYEGTPNVLCEAIACGLPVICSDVCDNPIYVQEGKNGFLFDPANPQDIANKIEHLLALKAELYRSYSKHSRAIAEEKLSEKVFFNKYLKLII